MAIPEHLSGFRLDQALVELFPDYSRNRLKQWVVDGQILLDGLQVKPKIKVYVGQALSLDIQMAEVSERCLAENIPINVVYEDDSLLVVNKPAGLVVHPAAGHANGTLQNALLFYDPALQNIPRAGIVHRLDKDTTGLMVVARTLEAHKALVDQIQRRDITREYQALVYGVVTAGGIVDQPIGRHPRDRIKKAVREEGRPSLTHYRVSQRYRAHSALHLKLETGRTHQIRVHMQHIKHSIVGDPIYAGRQRIPPESSENFIECIRGFKRQALHAWRLSLNHPISNELLSWQAELPEDMSELMSAMQKDLDEHGVK